MVNVNLHDDVSPSYDKLCYLSDQSEAIAAKGHMTPDIQIVTLTDDEYSVFDLGSYSP